MDTPHRPCNAGFIGTGAVNVAAGLVKIVRFHTGGTALCCLTLSWPRPGRYGLQFRILGPLLTVFRDLDILVAHSHAHTSFSRGKRPVNIYFYHLSELWSWLMMDDKPLSRKRKRLLLDCET